MRVGTKILAGLILLAVASSLGMGAQNNPLNQAPRPGAPAPAGFPIPAGELFFTEPFDYLDPPIKDTIGLSLDVDYALIKYEFGFVNAIDPVEPMIAHKKRSVIKDVKQLARITERTGFRVGDRMTVVSASGAFYPAVVVSFSYVGNSPSSIIVTADLKMETAAPDPTLFTQNGLALRGKRALPAVNPGLAAGAPLPDTDPLAQKLLGLCVAGVGDVTVQDPRVVPAAITAGAPPADFVSFWMQPKVEFEIDDVKLASCLFQPAGDTFTKIALPLPVRLLQVYDLDGNGKAELFGLTGDGLEVCLVYLAPEGTQYRLLRQGLCAGY